MILFPSTVVVHRKVGGGAGGLCGHPCNRIAVFDVSLPVSVKPWGSVAVTVAPLVRLMPSTAGLRSAKVKTKSVMAPVVVPSGVTGADHR